MGVTVDPITMSRMDHIMGEMRDQIITAKVARKKATHLPIIHTAFPPTTATALTLLTPTWASPIRGAVVANSPPESAACANAASRKHRTLT